jgi:hypothetical protein
LFPRVEVLTSVKTAPGTIRRLEAQICLIDPAAATAVLETDNADFAPGGVDFVLIAQRFGRPPRPVLDLPTSDFG